MVGLPFSWAEWGDFDAIGLAEAIRGQQVPIQGVMAQTAAAVERMNPATNSVIEMFADVIEDPSRAKANTQGPLYGVPILIKDMGSRIEGRHQEVGMAFRESQPAEMDDPLVENFREAGCVIVGRTAVPEDGMTLLTHSIKDGDVRSPFNRLHTPGGSSGGSSATVACGMTPMCSASDGAGSIRFPASWTGLIGLKTTRGLLPLPRGLDESLMSGASEGALTKSVRDCALIYEQLAVHRYWGNSFMPPPLMPPLLEESIGAPRTLRIGYCDATWGSESTLAPDIENALQQMIKRLSDLGHDVRLVRPQDICDFSVMRRAFAISEWVLPISKELEHEAAESGVALTEANASLQLRNHIEAGGMYTIDDFFAAKGAAEGLMRHWGEFWQGRGFDVLLTPVTPVNCPTLASDYRMDSPLPFEDWYGGLMDAACFTYPANYMGLPALSFPAGLDSAGCPMGMQFMGPWLGEPTLMHLGFQLERNFPELVAPRPAIHVSAEG